MLAELARTEVLARPERFDVDHRRAIEALESLRRHGFHGSQRRRRGSGRCRYVVRWLIELDRPLRRRLARQERRDDDAEPLLAARDGGRVGLHASSSCSARLASTRRPSCEIMRSREIGVPSFVIAGLLIPVGATTWRLIRGSRSTTGGSHVSSGSSASRSASVSRGSCSAAARWPSPDPARGARAA